MKISMRIVFAVFLVFSFIPMIAQASVIKGFQNITNNSTIDAAVGEAQLSVEIIDLGSFQIGFKFTNVGPASCSITDIYFYDGAMLNSINVSISDSDLVYPAGNVDFGVGASPPGLPGGNPLGLPSAWLFSSDSNPPSVFSKGVNNGTPPNNEWVQIDFQLVGGNTYSDVLATIESDDTVIGLHVQGFDDGGSESFINDGNGVIPEPGTLLLLGSGLAGLAGYGKLRFRRKRK